MDELQQCKTSTKYSGNIFVLMEALDILNISGTIHRGLRIVLKNSFLHAECEKIADIDFGVRCRSAPPVLRGPVVVSNTRDKSIPQEFTDKTTVMIRNIPSRFVPDTLLECVAEDFSLDMINFFYLPMDFKSGKNLGYCFINFVSTQQLLSFWDIFQSRRLNDRSDKLLSISLAKIQGYEKNFSLFKVSAVMTVALPKFRPMVVCSGCGQLSPLATDSTGGPGMLVVCKNKCT